MWFLYRAGRSVHAYLKADRSPRTAIYFLGVARGFEDNLDYSFSRQNDE